MNMLRTLLLSTLSCLCTGETSFCAQPAAQEDLAGMHLDASGRLSDLRLQSKGDLRDNVALFGHRPTLVVVGTRVQWRKSGAKDYVKSIKQLDKLAAKWKRSGFDVLFVAPDAKLYDAGSNDWVDLELLAKAKPKNMTCAHVPISESHLGIDEPVLERLLFMEHTTDFEFHWALIEQLGSVSASGADVFDKSLAKRRDAFEVPDVAKNSATKRIFAAICEWRLGDAQSLLLKLERGKIAEKHGERIEKLRAMLEESEAHYRRVLCEPQREREYMTEYAESLERFARRHFDENERILAEVAELRESPEFTLASEQHALYTEMLAAYEAMLAESERVYTESVGKRGDYDEAKYYRAILDVYPATLGRLRAFVKEHSDSPYRDEIARIVVFAADDLQDAKELAR